MKEINPFSLMFGKAPYSFIERQAQYQQITTTFNSGNPSTLAFLITGVRGCGKTVTLRRLAKEFSEKKDWIVLDVNPGDDLIEPLSEKLLYEGKKTKLFLDWSININAKVFTLEIKKGEGITNPEIIFESLLKKANESGKKVLITIDEVAPSPSMQRFANFYQSMVGKDYGIYLLMTGLKQNIDALVSSSASSFLSRMTKIELQPLDEIEIAREYQRILNAPLQTAVSLAKLTNGYAFAYQVFGYFFFERGEGKITEGLLTQCDRYLQTNGYSVIWKDLTEQEKNICYALAECKSGSGIEVATRSGLKKSNFQNYRARLIEKGIIFAPSYGKIAFSLPRFEQFVEALRLFREDY